MFLMEMGLTVTLLIAVTTDTKREKIQQRGVALVLLPLLSRNSFAFILENLPASDILWNEDFKFVRTGLNGRHVCWIHAAW